MTDDQKYYLSSNDYQISSNVEVEQTPQADQHEHGQQQVIHPTGNPHPYIGRLISTENTLLISEIITEIGRNTNRNRVHFHVHENVFISRKHLQLQYSNGEFYLLCLSKNGIFVDNVFIGASFDPVKLSKTCTFRFPSTKINVFFENLINEDIVSNNIQSIKTEEEEDTNAVSSSFLNVSLPEIKNNVQNNLSYEKPPYSYAQLIVQSICASNEKQLTLSEIYSFISNKYPYYRTGVNKGWQNSIRHNLSLNKYFVKVPRSQDEPGKGSFWRIDSTSEVKLIDQSYRKRRQRGNQCYRSPFNMPRSAPVSPSNNTNMLPRIEHESRERRSLQDITMQSAPVSPRNYNHNHSRDQDNDYEPIKRLRCSNV